MTTQVKITSSAKDKVKPGKALAGKTGYTPASKKVEEYPPRELIYVRAEKTKHKN